MQMKKNQRRKLFRTVLSMLFVATIFIGNINVVFAENSDNNDVLGKVYQFEDGEYEISGNTKYKYSNESQTYGKFSISGKIECISDIGGVPSFTIDSDDLKLSYTYSDTLLTAKETEWHLTSDSGKKVDGIKLDGKIEKGTIIIQTSKDRKNWTNVETYLNQFEKEPNKTDSLYKATDVQLINGCYYRITVAYELEKLTKSDKFLFVPVREYDSKKIVEVYEFYAASTSASQWIPDSEQTYALGDKVRCKEFDGYYGSEKIGKSDVHYGWNIGEFFVSGYTDTRQGTDKNVVFLKNVGDKVTLWFNLEQDINKLNGNENLSITSDTEGYDQYFETPRTNFGKGTLIIRYTDYNNNTSEPQIYTNYLEANTSIGADTKVQLFEEGDYEVALDYQITNDKLIDQVAHYRISFNFSVRNGNCMVYPMDIETGNELTNSMMTESGFTLDLAKSRYLMPMVKREVLSDSADGLVEDTRFNGPAKDGAKYTDEGIYTITVTNEYTQQSTTKKIYVGTNSLMKAYMTSGLPIEEIKKLVNDGATIDDNGVIRSSCIQPSKPLKNNYNLNNMKDSNVGGGIRIRTHIIVIVVVIIIVIIVFSKKKKNTVWIKSVESNTNKEENF